MPVYRPARPVLGGPVLHWLRELLSLSFDKDLTTLVTIAVALGVWRTFIMLIQFVRPNAVRRFYPIYIPVTLVIIVASLYISAVRTFAPINPRAGLILLAALTLLIAGLVVWQAAKYVRSLLPGGTTPCCAWYKAWPLRLLRGALPFTLTWVLSMLVLAILLRELARNLLDLSILFVQLREYHALALTLAGHAMHVANFFVGVLPIVFMVWAAITFVRFLALKGWEGIKNIGNRGHHTP